MRTITLITLLTLAGCSTINTPQTPCHGKELPTGSCPYSAVLDQDGTACHHVVNCGSLNQ